MTSLGVPWFERPVAIRIPPLYVSGFELDNVFEIEHRDHESFTGSSYHSILENR